MDTRELASGIKGTVVTPGDENYETSIKRWAENSERKAAVVVLVQCAEDVSAAVGSKLLSVVNRSSDLLGRMDLK